jgi:hypothetical protein
MTTLRARLFASLLLASMSLAVFGVGASWASHDDRHDRRDGSGSLPRQYVTPTSGEPDGGGHSVPTIRPASLITGYAPVFAQLWYQWVVERHQTKTSRRH